MVRLKVNYDLCEGNAACEKTAPDMFKVDERDVMHLLVEAPSEAQMEKARAAVRRCPKWAISLVEG